MSARLRIGVAGWDYPDWSGVVYPPSAPRGFDRLAFLAQFVELVEINSTFYRHAAARSAEAWVRRTGDRQDFRFTAKAHRSWTHEPGADLALEMAAGLDGLRPLRDAGRLGALLLQFPQSFHFEPGALEHLERLGEGLDGWPAVVEVRHASWAAAEAREWLGDRGLGWCAVDQPRVGRTTLRLIAEATSPVGYVRLHGRNRVAWFQADAGRDARYDYLYTERELAPVAQAARELAQRTTQLFVVQNNHFRGQALVNALVLRHLVEGERPAAPSGLVAAFPQLASHLTATGDRLF